MLRITYINSDGTLKTVEAEAGTSVMHAAVTNGVDGIKADCGGAASCATCHVYVEPAWTNLVGPAGDIESDMLDFTASERQTNSRLSCQINLVAALDGLVVRLPEKQS